VAGLRLLPVSEGIWRADLFRNKDGEIVYHYHPHFEKGDVGQRFFDDLLTRNPVEFVMRRLADLRAVLVDSGAGDVADDVPYAEIEPVLPAIREAIERSFEPVATPA
jgi:hypothetical protein